MKKVLFFVVSIFALVSCSKSGETIAVLQDAANGEANASARYAQFAQSAANDSLLNIHALFMATSRAEAIHLKSILRELKHLGVDYQPVVEASTVDSVISNLYAAKSGEEYEVQSMYPEMASIALAEGNKQVADFFNATIITEESHARLYIAAIEALQTTGSDATVASMYMVCPSCGDIYTVADNAHKCKVCQTDAHRFEKFIGAIE